MSVSGEAIHVVLRVDGDEVEQIRVHPSLLDGPFILDGMPYRVQRREVSKRDVFRVVQEIVRVNDDFPVLGFARKQVPEWVVILDLVKASSDA